MSVWFALAQGEVENVGVGGELVSVTVTTIVTIKDVPTTNTLLNNFGGP